MYTDQIIEVYRLRQDMIKAMTKLSLQAQAVIRRISGLGKEDNVSAILKAAKDDPTHKYHTAILPQMMAMEPLEAQRKIYEKELVRLVKKLPAYDFVKATKGFGDMSFACIIGEAGDLSNYSSYKKLWKRLGVAVMKGGVRQGRPGANPTNEDWIEHGYNKGRCSVVWNASNGLIGGMGLFRPKFGEDVHANEDYSPMQRLFVERARHEQVKLGKEVGQGATGKESYCAQAADRAKRYVAKYVLRELWKDWVFK